MKLVLVMSDGSSATSAAVGYMKTVLTYIKLIYFCVTSPTMPTHIHPDVKIKNLVVRVIVIFATVFIKCILIFL